MPKTIDIAELLKANPHISEDELIAAMRELRALRAAGLRNREYGLAVPYGGHRVSISEDAEKETRTVRLRHNRGHR